MTFDSQVQSITQDEIVPHVVDNVSTGNVLGLLFLSSGSPWSGETLKIPVKLTQATQGGSFSDFQAFSVNNENVRQLASYDVRAYYQSVVIGGLAQSVNGVSKTQVLNLVKVEMESAGEDMASSVATKLYGDGTGNSNMDFLGLAAGIDDGMSVDTYGGISRASNPNWKSGFTNATSLGSIDNTKMRNVFNNASIGMQRPTVGVTPKDVFGYIEKNYTSTLQGHYMVNDSSRGLLTWKGLIPNAQRGLSGYMGFDYLFFSGVPIVRDDKATAGDIIYINQNQYKWYGLKLVNTNPVDLRAMYHEGNDYDQVPSTVGFAWTGFVRPADQYAFIGQILLAGNLITAAPRLHTRGSGITS